MLDVAERTPELAQPEPGLRPETLVERAAALRPLLLEQQEANDWRGHYSDEVHEAFRKAGFYRILQPRLFGGYELEPKVFLQVVMELAHGHPGAAWCFTLAGSHGFFVGSHFPEEVQRELFSPDGEFRSGQVVGPFGTMTPAEGGYIVDGVFPFTSGSPVSTHFIGGSLIHREGAPPRHVYFVLPRERITILPDWGEGRFMGMQASGSNSVKVEGQFVPDRHILDITMLTSSEGYPGGVTPGLKLHGNPMYIGVQIGWFHLEFAAILTGAARAALDEFQAAAKSKPMFGNPMQKRMQDPFVQNLVGHALALADSAEALTLAGADLYLEQLKAAARESQPVTPAETMKVWGLGQQACRLAAEAVERLFHASGAGAGRKQDRLQRYFRDIEMYRLHIQNQPTLPTVRGQLALGIEAGLFG